MTNEYLKELLIYDMSTGVFRWKVSRGHNKIKIGDIAGCIEKKDGYRVIKIDGKVYKEHRLAWLYMYNSFPIKYIDHINGNRTDNRICNLREATCSENTINSKISNRNNSGYKGVSKSGNKWRAYIMVDSKSFYLGTFKQPELAHEAYKEASLKYHGAFSNFG
jgi:hypothetical protein